MSRVRAYAQLLRLPNVFTALADICLGGLALWARAERSMAGEAFRAWLWLLPASACLYCAGMVWNDFFDLEQDRRERPFRPLPSGRVSRATAGWLGTVLLAAGILLAARAGWHEDVSDRTSGVLAAILAIAILLYDGWLKRTWAGPLGMGACRFLNVLLGLSARGTAGEGWKIHLASVVGLYVVGVTWFARTEARTSRSSSLTAAAALMLAATALALPVPLWVSPGTGSSFFIIMLVSLGFLVGVPVLSAIQRPNPARVQGAVKRAILGLIILDATLAAGMAGDAGWAILLLLPPALYVGRWIYST
jgi:4-hydroxybenzoate polyprenyltransferase